ncbi:hypothetical protein AgCh_021016 [Apium graveolens]
MEGTTDHPSVEMYGKSERIDYDSRPIMLDPQLGDATEFSNLKIANNRRRKAPREEEISYKEMMRSPEFNPETKFHRLPKKSIRSLEFHHGRQTHRHPVRIQRNEGEEDSTIDLSHKREKTNEDWTRQHTKNSYSSKRVAYDRDTDRSQRFSNRIDTHRISAYEDRDLSYDREEHMLEHSMKGQGL